MHIKTDKPLTYYGGKHSFTITPEMGVVKHFPTPACLALIKKGAVEVTRKNSVKADKAKPAK